MSTNKILMAVIGVAVLIGGLSLMGTSTTPTDSVAIQEKSAPTPPVTPPVTPPTTPVADVPTPPTTEQAPTTIPAPAVVGSYEVYAPEKLTRAEQGPTVLFFKATWCPSCKALDADLQASRSEIPANVTILETDYDTYTDLKKKYGVTTQHTLVQVDAQGNMLTKWSGGSTLETVLAKVQI
jgi:thiol-disulfide isomerase/thioredoxin